MTKAVRISLITVSGLVSTGIIGAVGYVVGKKKGIELGAKQALNELNSAPVDAPRNTRTNQAQA